MTWVPRGTVMFCGHTLLFEIVIVVDVELAVHVPPVVDGLVLLELHAAPMAAAAIQSTPAAVRPFVCGILVPIV